MGKSQTLDESTRQDLIHLSADLVRPVIAEAAPSEGSLFDEFVSAVQEISEEAEVPTAGHGGDLLSFDPSVLSSVSQFLTPVLLLAVTLLLERVIREVSSPESVFWVQRQVDGGPNQLNSEAIQSQLFELLSAQEEFHGRRGRRRARQIAQAVAKRIVPRADDLVRYAKDGGESPAYGEIHGAGDRWAVLVGVNEYEDLSNYGRLRVCVKDAHAIREQLVEGSFDPARIRLLTDHTDKPPTKANVLVALKAVADATEPHDLLLFYYSGHGDEDSGESYLVARDGRRLVLSDTAVPVSRVKEIMEEAPARAKVIVLDACHSGADIGGKGPKPMSEAFMRRVFEQAEGMAVLASCKQGQLSYEWWGNERSVFTHFLLEALAGEADRDEKGFITVQDASRHVTNGVKLWASQRDTSQTPTLQYTVAGDIILVRYR